jgi:multiple sugar transport system substrate-binding protein
MLRKIKLFLILCLIAGVSLFIFGCAEKKQDGSVTVNIWIMPNSLEPIKDLEDILKSFEEEHPDIKVKVTSVDWGAAWTKITTAATSQDVPDIVQLGSTWVGSISSMNALLDVSDRISEIGGADSFVPAAWKSSGMQNSGQVTAIPWIVDARAIYYRTDVFDKVGLNRRSLDTWQSFDQALEKINKASPVIEGIPVVTLGISGKNDWNVIHSLAPWIWAAGGDFLSADLKSSALDSAEVLKGVLFYINFVKKGYVPLEYLELNTAQVSSNFNQGNSAIYFDGPYEVKTLTTPPQQGGASDSITARNFGVAPNPKGPSGRYTFVGGSNLAIFKASKNKDQAWKVIKHLMKKQSQIEYCKVTGFLPSRKEAFDHPYFAADPKRKVFKEAVKYGRTYPCIPAWGVLEPILTRRFGIMWDYVTGSKGPVDEEAIRNQLRLAKEEMDSVLRQSQ